MSLFRTSVLSVMIGCMPWAATARQATPAVLKGHAVLSAARFVAPPADAPELLRSR